MGCNSINTLMKSTSTYIMFQKPAPTAKKGICHINRDICSTVRKLYRIYSAISASIKYELKIW